MLRREWRGVGMKERRDIGKRKIRGVKEGERIDRLKGKGEYGEGEGRV